MQLLRMLSRRTAWPLCWAKALKWGFCCCFVSLCFGEDDCITVQGLSLFPCWKLFDDFVLIAHFLNISFLFHFHLLFTLRQRVCGCVCDEGPAGGARPALRLRPPGKNIASYYFYVLLLVFRCHFGDPFVWFVTTVSFCQSQPHRFFIISSPHNINSFCLLFSLSSIQVTREQMFCEFDYTLGLNEATLPGLDKMITTSASAMDAIQVWIECNGICVLCFDGVVAWFSDVVDGW